MRALRYVAVGALVAAGIAARVSTPPVPTTTPIIESRGRAVACASVERCLAVGSMGSVYGVRIPFATQLAAGAWTLVSPAAPSPLVESVFTSLACDPTGSCVAVGREEVPAPYLGARSAGDRPLIADWDGSVWAGARPPIPPGTTVAELNGVSCSSSTCVAVGQYGLRRGTERVLATVWDGARWRLQLPPRHRYEDDASFQDVACVSPTSCVAVGQFGFELQELFTGVAPLIVRWDGKAWHLEVSDNARDSLDTELNAIACPSSDRCVAVGFRRHTGGTYSTFAEIRRGTRWTLVRTPDPEGSPDAELADVACPRIDLCIAVGSWVTGSQVRSLVETWDGTRWTIEETPAPEGATSSALSGIDCPAPTTCYAVGAYERGSPTEHAFAQAWDGSTWTIMPVPEPVGPE
jgi:hypothetical protein